MYLFAFHMWSNILIILFVTCHWFLYGSKGYWCNIQFSVKVKSGRNLYYSEHYVTVASCLSWKDAFTLMDALMAVFLNLHCGFIVWMITKLYDKARIETLPLFTVNSLAMSIRWNKGERDCHVLTIWKYFWHKIIAYNKIIW